MASYYKALFSSITVSEIEPLCWPELLLWSDYIPANMTRDEKNQPQARTCSLLLTKARAFSEGSLHRSASQRSWRGGGQRSNL